MRLLGICSPIIDYITEFIIRRATRVSVSGIRSSFMDVWSGVPQRNVLGPLLFLLFVDNLPTNVISKYKFSANDLKTYLSIRHSNIVDTSSDLFSCQRDIDNIVHVVSSWD